MVSLFLDGLFRIHRYFFTRESTTFFHHASPTRGSTNQDPVILSQLKTLRHSYGCFTTRAFAMSIYVLNLKWPVSDTGDILSMIVQSNNGQ